MPRRIVDGEPSVRRSAGRPTCATCGATGRHLDATEGRDLAAGLDASARQMVGRYVAAGLLSAPEADETLAYLDGEGRTVLSAVYDAALCCIFGNRPRDKKTEELVLHHQPLQDRACKTFLSLREAAQDYAQALSSFLSAIEDADLSAGCCSGGGGAAGANAKKVAKAKQDGCVILPGPWGTCYSITNANLDTACISFYIKPPPNAPSDNPCPKGVYPIVCTPKTAGACDLGLFQDASLKMYCAAAEFAKAQKSGVPTSEIKKLIDQAWSAWKP